MAEGYWNGLPTSVRRVIGTVPPHDPEIHAPLAWWKHLSGESLEAVEVVLDGVNHGGGVCHLDNRDGSGWHKVTDGRGSPRWAHREVPLIDVEEVF